MARHDARRPRLKGLEEEGQLVGFTRADCCSLWSPYGTGQTVIFLPRGFFFLSSFFSSPDLSRRRFDVYHTSTHGVALVRISDAGLKRAARSLLQMQDAKKSQKILICAPSYNFVGLYLHN